MGSESESGDDPKIGAAVIHRLEIMTTVVGGILFLASLL